MLGPMGISGGQARPPQDLHALSNDLDYLFGIYSDLYNF